MIGDQLPKVYRPYFSSQLLRAEVPEKLATCDNCLMSRQPKAGLSYQAHLKCCTYHPFQPNFLIGEALVLNGAAPRALQSIESKVRDRQFVLPIGIVAPLSHQVEFNSRKGHEFGNREDWLCPYYNLEKQNCGIWQHRGAVCSTFYCESQHGPRGVEFWQRLSDYLTYVEMALMEEALVMLDFSPRQISENLDYLNRFELTVEERESLGESSLSLPMARKIWNGYFDDQLGFYRRCYAIVQQMNKKQFREAMGDQGNALEKDLLRSLKGI